MDLEKMKKAIELAKRGMGYVSPNPMVGCVIVKHGKMIGFGWHEKYGEPHAERNALKNCTESPEGAEMYVTLEPCCHYGKQPPCTDAIIESGIRRVYVGSDDPNPKVAGKGLKALRDAGIEVVTGVMKEECDSINRIFFHYIKHGTPYVTMKYAMSLDGKIAAATGDAEWISGVSSRRDAHTERLRHTAIMAGIGTVLADDPLLTCRISGGRDPIRIICDTHLRTPLDSQIVSTADKVPTVIAAADDARRGEYEERGIKVLKVGIGQDGHIDLSELMRKLGGMQIDSILLEGGSELNWSMLSGGHVDHVKCYLAGMLLGGRTAKSPIGGEGFPSPRECFELYDKHITALDDDLIIEGEVRYKI